MTDVQSRRSFLTYAGLGAVSLVTALSAGAQDRAAPASGATSNLFDMNQSAAKTTRRPPKPGAQPSMSADNRDALEHEIRCQCGCTLDVYICRTTDFSCEVSPAMHRDVISLVEGGYSAQEILDAFVGTYGERALMSPRKEGFNWFGYLVPAVTIGVGAVALVTVLRSMKRKPVIIARGASTVPVIEGATGEEMARLEQALRRDD